MTANRPSVGVDFRLLAGSPQFAVRWTDVTGGRLQGFQTSAAQIAAVAERLRAEGMRAPKAFSRALELCRDPDAPLIPETVGGSHRTIRNRPARDRLLAYLQHHDAVPATQIAEDLCLDVSAVRALLRRLDARGEVTAVGEATAHPAGGMGAQLWGRP